LDVLSFRGSGGGGVLLADFLGIAADMSFRKYGLVMACKYMHDFLAKFYINVQTCIERENLHIRNLIMSLFEMSYRVARLRCAA
jgi:hypothetical protein